MGSGKSAGVGKAEFRTSVKTIGYSMLGGVMQGHGSGHYNRTGAVLFVGTRELGS